MFKAERSAHETQKHIERNEISHFVWRIEYDEEGEKDNSRERTGYNISFVFV